MWNSANIAFKCPILKTFEECVLQVWRAGEFIAQRAHRSRPQFFAYPYGTSSTYIRENYFPEHVTMQSNRWSLPRYVCGSDWKTPEGFERTLKDQNSLGKSV